MTSHPATANRIQPTGCPIQKTYSVCRMIFRPRVPPRYDQVTAANGIARAAAQNDTRPWWCRSGWINTPASHEDSANTTSPTATETMLEIQTDLRTSARIRPCSPRPARMATSRTFATSIPNRVAVDAMNANCVVTVTTPNSEGPSVRVIAICVTNVARTPTASPTTFW